MKAPLITTSAITAVGAYWFETYMHPAVRKMIACGSISARSLELWATSAAATPTHIHASNDPRTILQVVRQGVCR